MLDNYCAAVYSSGGRDTGIYIIFIVKAICSLEEITCGNINVAANAVTEALGINLTDGDDTWCI